MALAGRKSPLTEESHSLLQEWPDGDRSEEVEREDIRRLEPVLVELFTAARRAGSALLQSVKLRLQFADPGLQRCLRRFA